MPDSLKTVLDALTASENKILTAIESAKQEIIDRINEKADELF